jgi:hypothetical protein
MNIKMDLSTTEQACLQFALENAIGSLEEVIKEAKELPEEKGDILSIKMQTIALNKLKYVQRRLQAEGLAIYSLEEVLGITKPSN